MKILVPVDSASKDTNVASEFARAPYFAIIDDGKVSFERNENASARGGAGPRAAQFAVSHGVNKVIVKAIGPNASAALESSGISVEVKNANKLEELL